MAVGSKYCSAFRHEVSAMQSFVDFEVAMEMWVSICMSFDTTDVVERGDSKHSKEINESKLDLINGVVS